jgi:HSP20 family protein
MNKLTRYHHPHRDLISQLQEDINHFLTPFDVRYEWMPSREWLPHVDIKEEEKQYVVRADIPGVKPADVDINVENGVLTIKGKRESESKKEEENYLRIERASGSFIRQVMLPDAIDQEKIQAKCHDGVLEVLLPKAVKGAGRKIKVQEE